MFVTTTCTLSKFACEDLLVGFGFGPEKDADDMVSGCSRVGVSVSEIVVR